MNLAAIPNALPPGALPAPRSFEIRRLTLKDIRPVLVAGYRDLEACRTDALLMAVMYPVAGVVLAGCVVNQGFLPFVFPLFSGFALLGPLATLWFAALSRRRERGDDTAESVFNSHRRHAIQHLAAIAVGLYLVWNAVAAIIFYATLGSSTADAGASFFTRVFSTTAGWELIVFGCLAGAVFAVATLAISLVSFSLVIDRDVSALQAVSTSLHAVMRNPDFCIGWGLVVVTELVLGAIPCLLGLVVVLPVLGHGTWHVYRRMVV
jgi:uncharacterized membrane protein